MVVVGEGTCGVVGCVLGGGAIRLRILEVMVREEMVVEENEDEAYC